MSTHFVALVVIMITVAAIAVIGIGAYLAGRINDLGIITRATADKQRNESLEMRIAIKGEAESWAELFEAHCEEIEERMKKYDFDVITIRDGIDEIVKMVDPAETGEIDLPDLSIEYEEQFHKEMVDNKDLVCRKLAEFLRYTRAGEDIESITYEKVEEADGFSYEEYAVIKFQNGFTKGVTITGDSGRAIAMDVIASL